MADNKNLPGTGTGTADIKVATRSVSYSGDTADVQTVGIGVFAGSDDAKTVTDVSTAAPFPVAVTDTVVEDAAETAAGKLFPVGTVRRDTAASSAGTTGDNATLNTDASGQVWVIDSPLIAKFANAIEIAPAATTMSAGAYVALDQVGTLLTFASVVSANGRACRLESMYIGNKANTAPLLQLWLFNAAPTLTSPGDNNAWQPTDADMATLIDVVDCGPWYAGAATALNQWSRIAGLGRVLVTAAATSIYGYLVLAAGGALTGASTTDLTVRLVVTPDV